jgi:hypothetical protein
MTEDLFGRPPFLQIRGAEKLGLANSTQISWSGAPPALGARLEERRGSERTLNRRVSEVIGDVERSCDATDLGNKADGT